MKKNILTIFLFLTSLLSAQVAKDSELFLALKKHDSVFFEKSFNECDLVFLEKAIHNDMVFYHDQGGVQNKTKFLESVKNNICSNPNQKPIRKVKGESLEVFPLYQDGQLYGVIQNGIHEFYIREPHKKDVLTSTARFTHVYLLENNDWILKEVLSFDHQNKFNSIMLLVAKYIIILFGLFFFFAGSVMLFNPTKFRKWVSMAGSTNFINYAEITLRLIPAAAIFYYAEESKFPFIFQLFGGFMMLTSFILYFVPRYHHHQLSLKFSEVLKPFYFQMISPFAFLIGFFIVYSVL